MLFCWIKQHLRIRRFLGNNDNAIRLQIFAAMIAYALLRIAARRPCVKIPTLRFTTGLFQRRHLGAIDKPPPVPKTPTISCVSAMSEVPRTALSTAGEGGPSPTGLGGRGLRWYPRLLNVMEHFQCLRFLSTKVFPCTARSTITCGHGRRQYPC